MKIFGTILTGFSLAFAGLGLILMSEMSWPSSSNTKDLSYTDVIELAQCGSSCSASYSRSSSGRDRSDNVVRTKPTNASQRLGNWVLSRLGQQPTSPAQVDTRPAFSNGASFTPRPAFTPNSGLRIGGQQAAADLQRMKRFGSRFGRSSATVEAQNDARSRLRSKTFRRF